jgi:hypothetical protein
MGQCRFATGSAALFVQSWQRRSIARATDFMLRLVPELPRYSRTYWEAAFFMQTRIGSALEYCMIEGELA